jgi:hypothetical protein
MGRPPGRGSILHPVLIFIQLNEKTSPQRSSERRPLSEWIIRRDRMDFRIIGTSSEPEVGAAMGGRSERAPPGRVGGALPRSEVLRIIEL